MKGAWPVEAMALGGRQYRGDAVDQNFDVYAVQYTYPDGTHLFFDGRNMPGVHNEFASFLHGSKGSAVVSTNAHTPGHTRIYSGRTSRAGRAARRCRRRRTWCGRTRSRSARPTTGSGTT
jgi:hypothetical protein